MRRALKCAVFFCAIRFALPYGKKTGIELFEKIAQRDLKRE